MSKHFWWSDEVCAAESDITSVRVGVNDFDAPVKSNYFQHVHGTLPCLGTLPMPGVFDFRNLCWMAEHLFLLYAIFTSLFLQPRNPLREHVADPEQTRLPEQGHMHKAHTHTPTVSLECRGKSSTSLKWNLRNDVYSFGRQAGQECVCNDGMHEQRNVPHNPHTVELKPKPWATRDIYLSAHAHEGQCPIDWWITWSTHMAHFFFLG